MRTLYEYYWKGISINGQKQQGRLRASSKNAARQHLAYQKITLLQLRRRFLLQKKTHPSIFALNFTQNLYSLISQKISLEQALCIMSKTTKDNDIKYVVTHAINDLRKGTSLTKSLEQSKQFSLDYLHMLDCAEESNQLSQTLYQLQQHIQNQINVRKQIKKSLRYPLFVIVITAIIIAALMIFVIPQFETTFANNGKSLPALTQILLTLSRFTREHSTLLLLFTACLIFTLKGLAKTHLFRRWLQQILFSAPILSHYYHAVVLQQFFQTISFSLQSGLTLPIALSQYASRQRTSIIKNIIQQVTLSLQAGNSFSQTLQKHAIFTSEMISLISIAEETNSLTTTCAHISEQLTNRIYDITDSLSSQIEPVMMLVLSLVIGTVVVAMYLPLFQLGSVLY